MESLGDEGKDDDEKPVVHIYRGGQEQGTIQVQLIMRHALKENKPDDKRRRQLRAILKKYRDLSANKEELTAAMKKKFGISLVFVGKADTPYGYIVVDHKNKTVFKGGEFLSIKELLQFEDAATRFAKIKQTIDDLLADNPKLTTADINRTLYRQFGTRIHRGTVSWNGETIQLRPEVTEQLRQNYLASRGIHPAAHSTTNINPLPPQGDNRGNDIQVQSPASAGAADTNREWELNGSMDMSVDDEAAQRRKWRR